MNKKENVPASGDALTGTSGLGYGQSDVISEPIITENEDNFTDKTAKRIFEVLGAIYAKENGLDVDVTVYKNGKVV